jgi:uncharacterized Zn-binding protein involved in type VI secretion
MTKIQEAKLVLKKAGFKVTEGSFDPSRFEYSRGRQGDNNPNDAKPTGVRYSKSGNIHEGEGSRSFLEAKKTLTRAGYRLVKPSDKIAEARRVLARAGIKTLKEGDEMIDPEQEEIVEAKRVLARAGIKVVREGDEMVDPEQEEIVEAKRVLARAGVKVVREGDEMVDPEQEEIVESKKARLERVRAIIEAKKVLKKHGFNVVREDYDQDIDYTSNISVPGGSEDQKPELKNNGNEAITTGGYPQASTEEGDRGIPGSFKEAVRVLAKSGMKVIKESKLKEFDEFGSGAFDDEGGFGDSEPPMGSEHEDFISDVAAPEFGEDLGLDEFDERLSSTSFDDDGLGTF